MRRRGPPPNIAHGCEKVNVIGTIKQCPHGLGGTAEDDIQAVPYDIGVSDNHGGWFIPRIAAVFITEGAFTKLHCVGWWLSRYYSRRGVQNIVNA